MNLPTAPRIPPLPEGERSPEQQALLDQLLVGPTVNIYATAVRNPRAAGAMFPLGRTLRSGRLPERHREVLILRTGWNCRSVYEFAQHRRIALSIGMTLDDVRRIQRGPHADGWDPFEAVLCRAADEIHVEYGISDATWGELAAGYDEQQLLEAVMLVGYYHLVSFLLNSVGVPLEPGAEGFLPDD